MIEYINNEGWKQHFPTYHFEERDIALEEYKVAAKNLEAEERVFLNASNITLVSSAALSSLIVGSSLKLVTMFSGIIPNFVIFTLLLIVLLGFSYINLKYFSDRQKAIIFAGRKVIILRRMLGLSYGQVQLLLPNWRIEGADQPLSLRLFSGWSTYVAYPFWVVAITSCSALFLLCAYYLKINPETIPNEYYIYLITLVTFIWFIYILYIYRSSLFDTHERTRLIIYKKISKLIKLPLVSNFEYVIYRAKLATYEVDRLNVDLKNLKKLLVFIEDREFYKHSGVSYKALFRAINSQLFKNNKSGGSTIIQQLIRTLFIQNLKMKKRRKFVEIGLAPWVNSILDKDKILEIYLSSVRFERGVFGILDAMEFFWGEHKLIPSKAESFFLIERVSNIRSKLLVNKICDTALQAKEKEILSTEEMHELGVIYQNAVSNEKINADEGQVTQLLAVLNA